MSQALLRLCLVLRAHLSTVECGICKAMERARALLAVALSRPCA